MKTKILIIAIHILLSVAFLQAQVVRTMNVTTAGTLNTLLGTEKTTITDLTLTGTINAADFTAIKQMTALKDLNMGAVNIDNGTIPNEAFKNKVYNNLILPTSLKSIGFCAFQKTSIPVLDFSECADLEQISQCAFLESNIGNSTIDLSECLKLKTFGSYGIHSQGVFTSFSGHVVLPKNMTTLPNYTFSKFTGTISFPQIMEVIGASAFYGAVLPEGISLPTSLKSIGFCAFQKTSIPVLDFSECADLEQISQCAFLESNIGNSTIDLSECLKLKTFGSYGIHSQGVFTSFSGHVVLPKNMTTLPNYTFSKFTGSVVFPPVLETIGTNAFENASLTKGLTFPASLKTIGDRAFYNAVIPSIEFEGMDMNLSCP